MDRNKLEQTIDKVKQTVDRLRGHPGSPKILVKIARNLGDTLHGTPIIRHYREKYPDAAIAFMTEGRYANVHELNRDINVFGSLPNDLDPQIRIEIKRFIDNNFNDIEIKICPSIFPFGEIWESHRWSHPYIHHQYFANANIDLSLMMGDKRLHAPVSDNDLIFANEFVAGRQLIGMEYHSYSHPLCWSAEKFTEFVRCANSAGYGVVGFAGRHEGQINGMIDGRGMNWRRTIAVLSKCKAMLAIGSGIGMLAGCARPSPFIAEIGVSESISMKEMGYVDRGMRINGNTSPQDVMNIIKGN